MKTDVELLESAAKAVGITERVAPGVFWGVDGAIWSPLTDDGDALRLAVVCCLPLDIEDYQTLVQPLGICEPHGTDAYLATRRAIVRAAAVIGELAA